MSGTTPEAQGAVLPFQMRWRLPHIGRERPKKRSLSLRAFCWSTNHLIPLSLLTPTLPGRPACLCSTGLALPASLPVIFFISSFTKSYLPSKWCLELPSPATPLQLNFLSPSPFVHLPLLGTAVLISSSALYLFAYTLVSCLLNLLGTFLVHLACLS